MTSVIRKKNSVYVNSHDRKAKDKVAMREQELQEQLFDDYNKGRIEHGRRLPILDDNQK